MASLGAVLGPVPADDVAMVSIPSACLRSSLRRPLLGHMWDLSGSPQSGRCMGGCVEGAWAVGICGNMGGGTQLRGATH